MWFDVRNLVLKWDKPHGDKGKHQKFEPLWIAPSVIEENLNHNSLS